MVQNRLPKSLPEGMSIELMPESCVSQKYLNGKQPCSYIFARRYQQSDFFWGVLLHTQTHEQTSIVTSHDERLDEIDMIPGNKNHTLNKHH